LDIHSLRVLSLGPDYGFSLQDIERTDLPDIRFKWTVDVRGASVTGFFPYVGGTANIWTEGTGQACVGFYKSGYSTLGDFYVGQLEKLIIDCVDHPQTKCLPYLALPDVVGHSWVDTSRGSTSSACWYLFAQHTYDPMDGSAACMSEATDPVCRIQAENYDTHSGFVRMDANPPVQEGSAIHLAGDDSDSETDDGGWVECSFVPLDPIGNAAVRVRYADDIHGAPAGDVCTVKVDGGVVASFNTNAYSSGGWSDYVWTERFPIGPLSSGIHALRLEAADGETYGFTVDCIEIVRE
jgi:hypothetical protein